MAGQGSARVTLREIDLSQVRNPQQLPQGVPAAVVGPARKGPAFVPQTFATMQQFNEVFGNMLEVGREGNSNQFGPLALNEWMQSAQAGTYLRVLGVGNGLPSSGGKTSEAGFVVGEKQLQTQQSGIAKVGDNPHATIEDSTAAIALGRTHMLGCFMKDTTGSNFLKDAGVETEGAAASLVIEFGAQPIAGDTIKLDSVDAAGALNGDVTFTFNGGGNNPAIGGDVVATLTNLKASIENVANATGAGQDHEIIVSAVEDVNGDQTLARITLTSAFPEALDSTNDCIAKFNLNPQAAGDDLKVKVGDKTASVTNATFNFAQEGGSGAKCVISITDIPENNSSITLTSLDNDNVGGLTDALVAYTFTSTAIDATAVSGATSGGEVGRFTVEANAIAIDASAGKTKEDVLANLKAALDRADSEHAGKFATSISDDGLSLTVTQLQKGVAGRAAADGATENILLTNVTNLSVLCAEVINTAGDDTLTATGDDGFFFGGEDADSTSFTMTLTGQPNDNDAIRFCMLAANGTDETFERFRFKTGGVTGNESGTSTSAPDNNTNHIIVGIGDDLQETLYNLKNAIRSTTNTSHTPINLTAEVIDSTDSIKFTLTNGGGNLLGVLKNVVNISDVATFSNPAGETLVGNFGEKSENFSGGGGAAAPVIRGVLMTPQGVRAALDVNDNLAQFVSTVDANTTQIRSVAHGKTFGNTAGQNLTGYIVGEVDDSQGFKLILNGYSNTENPAVLDCSFDPNSPSYFSKVLNTDPTKMEELGHYLYASWDVNSAVAVPSNVGLRHAGGQLSGNFTNMKGFLLSGSAGRANSDAGRPDYEDFSSKFATARTPWIVSQFYSAGANTAARPGTAAEGGAVKLFRLYSLDDGEISNGQFRLLISNLRYGGQNDYGSFDMSLERFDSNPIKGTVIAAWKNANLDPDSRNFIGRLVGDKHIYYDFESDLGKQRLREEGQYDVKNPYVRIELSDALKQGDVEPDALPVGFQGHAHLFTNSNLNFIEQADLAANRVFTSSDNNATDILSTAQVTPLDFVTSINRVEGSSSLVSDDDLAWGVKFALRENQHISYTDLNGNLVKGHKELTEQVFNKSIKSWTKFFPSFGENPAWITDGNSADQSQNSFFSLEKIEIPKTSLKIQNSDGTTVSETDEISKWDGAVYRRLSSTSPGGRFVKISQDALGGNSKYLKFRCLFQGGFDGVNIFDEEKAELSGVASLREGEDETNSQKFTGPTIMAYQRAVDVLTDKSATEFQLLAIPGQRSPRVTDYAIAACEDRFDALLIMDIVEKDALNSLIEDSDVKPHVRNTISLFSDRVLDTSFAAAYFPDVVVRRPSDNAPIVVPPTVGMLGVMSRNDAIADPWFAPAGLNRGRLSAIDSRVQMNRDLLDDLYDADINPIYVPAGRSGEVYAFGQKTLLQDQSALDRINVRRLLIDIRRKVKKVGEQLLFEPNRTSTLARFSSLVEPIMANVQERRGVTRYKVQIDSSTTTQNDIENNTIRGKIYLQPTKSVEFISLDFVVTNTIQQ